VARLFTFQTECLGPRERAFETIGTQLRRLDGIERHRFHEQTSFHLDDLIGPRLRHLTSAGLLIDGPTHVRLTRRGLCVADADRRQERERQRAA